MRAPRSDEIPPTLPRRDAAESAPTAEVGSSAGERDAGLTAEEPGRYELGAELGRGGMGRVVVALDTHLGREIALKELLAERAHGSIGATARFVREARVTGQLQHPSIVPVHELGQRADGTIYYTMKRIRGRSLASALREARATDERLKLISPFRDVCQAIAYAHARGVVHRDLKPDNVMVGEFGETLVVDWGIAKVRGDQDSRAIDGEDRFGSLPEGGQTVEGHAIGTPPYMSPEQARGELAAIDERTDVWGLGAILFEILTGRPPFDGDNAIQVLTKVLREPVPRVLELAPDAPRELAAIVDRALQRDPSARYASAKELEAEVAAYQDGRTVRAYDYSSLELVRRFVSRHRAGTTAALGIALAILAASVLVTRSAMVASRERDEAEAQRREAEIQRREAESQRRLAADREIAAHEALAEALLERADRALAEGDPHAAAIYAAASLDRDPGNPARPRDVDHELAAEAAERARERVARAYSTYVEATSSRTLEFVRHTEATFGADVQGDRVLVPLPRGLAIEDLATGERETIEIDGVVDPVSVRALDAARAHLRLDGRGVVVDLARRAVIAELPASVCEAVAGERLFLVTPEHEVVVRARSDLAELDRVSVTGPVIEPSPDGRALVQPSVAGTRLVRFPRAGEAARIATGPGTRTATFSPDGRHVAIARAAPSLVLLDVATLAVRELEVAGWSGYPTWLDERTLAIGLDGDVIDVHGIDARRRSERLRLGPAFAHVARRSGPWLIDLPIPRPDRPARATVFRFPSGARRESIAAPLGPLAIGLDAERGRLVIAATDAIRIQRVNSGELLFEEAIEPPRVSVDVAVAPDGAIAVIDQYGSVRLLEPGGVSSRVVLAHSVARSSLLAVAFSRDGEVIYASSPGSGAIRRWSRSRGELRPLEGHDGPVLGLAVSPDGTRLASASMDGAVRLWHLDDGDRAEIVERHAQLVSHVAFSPDGARLASADGDGWIRVYEGSRQLARYRAHTAWINRIAWWPDGHWIASASDDGTARVSAADGSAIDRIVRCAASCLAIAPSPTGDALHVHRDGEIARVPLVPGGGTREPRELLDRAQDAAGVRLVGLELVPVE